MKIENMESMDDQGMVYKVIVSRTIGRFWYKADVTETYAGNAIGWFNTETGSETKDPYVLKLLNDAARKVQIDLLIQKHNKSKIKTVR